MPQQAPLQPGDPRRVGRYRLAGRITGLPADGPVFLGGGARPNARFQALCNLAGIRPKTDV